jgi:hypothetical protein
LLEFELACFSLGTVHVMTGMFRPCCTFWRNQGQVREETVVYLSFPLFFPSQNRIHD